MCIFLDAMLENFDLKSYFERYYIFIVIIVEHLLFAIVQMNYIDTV